MADAEDIQTLVCDNGTGMVKAGFAGDDAPRAHSVSGAQKSFSSLQSLGWKLQEFTFTLLQGCLLPRNFGEELSNTNTTPQDPVANERFFEDEVVNVKKAGEDKKWQENSRTYVEVFCLGCESVLGKQMIAVESENVISRKGRYCLSLPKLIMWDGIRLLYAHSCQPVYDGSSSLKNSAAADDPAIPAADDEQETTST